MGRGRGGGESERGKKRSKELKFEYVNRKLESSNTNNITKSKKHIKDFGKILHHKDFKISRRLDKRNIGEGIKEIRSASDLVINDWRRG